MEELTKLPTNWCLKINDYTRQTAIDARTIKITSEKGWITSYLLNPKVKNSWRFERTKPTVLYVEITFEQFEKWVLNKNNERIYELW